MESPGLEASDLGLTQNLTEKINGVNSRDHSCYFRGFKSWPYSLLIKKRCLSGDAFFGNRANTHPLLVQEQRHRAASSRHPNGCLCHTSSSFTAAKPPQVCPRCHQVWCDTSSSASGRSLSSGCPKAMLWWAFHRLPPKGAPSGAFHLRKAEEETCAEVAQGRQDIHCLRGLKATHADKRNFQA